MDFGLSEEQAMIISVARQLADDFEEEEADEFETAEEVMDAIIALDDLHRAKKIPDEAYQARREELKERLKELA